MCLSQTDDASAENAWPLACRVSMRGYSQTDKQSPRTTSAAFESGILMGSFILAIVGALLQLPDCLSPPVCNCALKAKILHGDTIDCPCRLLLHTYGAHVRQAGAVRGSAAHQCWWQGAHKLLQGARLIQARLWSPPRLAGELAVISTCMPMSGALQTCCYKSCIALSHGEDLRYVVHGPRLWLAFCSCAFLLQI